ncbi:MAG: sensor domain-containing diguanylate cyclase [bacterium]|nr:sensor domain-containing diguanylate cyclase [bacterium]MDT8396717.1 sensor domain-containing diguanylate cyclase [bacterium]
MKDTFYMQLMDNLYDGVYFVDKDRIITYWNKGAERLTGYSKSTAQGRSCSDNFLAHVDDTGKRLCDDGCPLHEVLTDGQPREQDLYLHHRDGHRLPVSVRVSPITDDGGRIIGAVEIFSDNSIHVANQRRIDELEQLALLDTLTRIGNRRYLEMTLESKLAETARYNTQIAIFFMDIDNFKDINDTWGHDAGDEVLKVVSRTLNGVIRPMDILGRWGGEEFIAATTNINRGTARSIGERFRKLIERSSVPVNDQRITFTITVGATIARPDDDLASIVKRADQQMYKAKRAGKNRVAVG